MLNCGEKRRWSKSCSKRERICSGPNLCLVAAGWRRFSQTPGLEPPFLLTRHWTMKAKEWQHQIPDEFWSARKLSWGRKRESIRKFRKVGEHVLIAKIFVSPFQQLSTTFILAVAHAANQAGLPLRYASLPKLHLAILVVSQSRVAPGLRWRRHREERCQKYRTCDRSERVFAPEMMQLFNRRSLPFYLEFIPLTDFSLANT